MRLTREPIHVYILDPSRHASNLPAPLYITTSYADGTPAETMVQVRWGEHTATVRTNRFGIGKAMLVPGDGTIEVHARDATGLTGSWEQQFYSYLSQRLLVETDKSIYRRNELVKVRVAVAPLDSSSDVVITAVAGDVSVTSRVIHLVSGHGEAEFPYRREYAGPVVFSAWTGGASGEDSGSKAVAFPEASDLQLSVVPEKGTYRPGENATVRLNVKAFNGQPVTSVLGVAVVDQAVLERARTNQEFGHRPWFSCAFCASAENVQIGGVSLNDLFHLDFSKPLPDGLDLVAEALLSNPVTRPTLYGAARDEDGPRKVFSSLLDPIFTRVRTVLDLHYQETFGYPRDTGEFFNVLTRRQGPIDLRDPWGTPFELRFTTQREYDLIEFVSAGPDKRRGTEDDFVAWEIRRPYFLPYEKLLREALAVEEYPATAGQLQGLLAERGLDLTRLRDRWGTAYKVVIQTWGPNRHITLTSAGPDRKFDTVDDFQIFRSYGPYFRREHVAIERALQSAPSFPRAETDFRSVVAAAGIDLTQILDAWGNPYHVVTRTSMRYGDRRTGVAVRVYNGPLETRTEVTPVTQMILTVELRSSGPDRQEGTYDDFTIATFSTVLNEESAAPEVRPAAKLPPARASTGTITGTVSDVTGAVIPNAKITLHPQSSETAYEALTGPDGVYSFIAVPPGNYRLVFESMGFRREDVIAVPVTAGRTTVVDSRLDVGSVSQTVEVQARAATELMACSATVSGIVLTVTSTPRVREYFPETLLWAPEVETDEQGRAKIQFKLADNITTWKLAVIASTEDGRVAEAEADLRAFQPFFLDHNPPPVLTSGDEISLPVTVRNYLDSKQQVAVTLHANTWSEVRGASDQRITLAPNSSANVMYPLRIREVNEDARQRVTAIGAKVSDAIEKGVRVHPDGQETTQTLSDLVVGRTTLEISVPPTAIRGATHAEMRVSPSILSALLEGAEGILKRPNGCAEQTASGGLANLIALRYARAVHFEKAGFEERALENLAIARDGLYAYFEAGGGVSYWGRGNPDLAVSAHALGFLVAAAKFVDVDEDRLESLASWIEKQQSSDGQWSASPLTTALVARTLAAAQAAKVKVTPAALSRAYHHLANIADGVAEPYAMALFVLSAIDSGDAELARSAAMTLPSMARDERGGLYWDLQTNTPFYGWGTAGRMETTSLVVSALAAWRAVHPEDAASEGLVRKGIVFLLRHRDRYGVWYSTQATARAMQAIADASTLLGGLGGKGGSIDIRINGHAVKTVPLPADQRLIDPMMIDIGALLAPGENHIELIPSNGAQNALVRVTATHWTPWSASEPRTSSALRLAVSYDRAEVAVGETVRCRVRAERVGFRGYGMMLAEIGLPPGAEVDRASLEKALLASEYSINQYDVLPDRVILYLWPRAGGADFTFTFRPRMAMRAKAAASELYDYYNPDAAAEVSPTLLVVR